MNSKPRLRQDKSRVNLRLEMQPTIPKAELKEPPLLGAPFKLYLKHKTLTITSEEDCPLCQQKIRKKNMPRLIHKALASKYSNSINYFYTKDINEILAGNKCRAQIELEEDGYWMPRKENLIGYVVKNKFKERFDNLWKYHQFNIDQPKQEYKGIAEVVEAYFHGKRKIQEKAIKKMLDVMTDSELEACEIHLSRFGSQPVEIVEKSFDCSDRVIPKALYQERKASNASLSIIEAVGNFERQQGLKKGTKEVLKSYSTYFFQEYGDIDQPWELPDLQPDKGEGFENLTKKAGWPSFIEYSEQEKLDLLIKQKEHSPKALNHNDAPKEKCFIKKGHKEKINLALESSKSKPFFRPSIQSGIKDHNPTKFSSTAIKYKKTKEISKTGKVSSEKLRKAEVLQNNELVLSKKEIISMPSNLKCFTKKFETKDGLSTIKTEHCIKSPRLASREQIPRAIRKMVNNAKSEWIEFQNQGVTSKSVGKDRQKTNSKSKLVKQKVFSSARNEVKLFDKSVKAKSTEKRLSSNSQKKNSDQPIAGIASKLTTTDSKVQKLITKNLESSSAKSIGLGPKKFESESKRLKSRPKFGPSCSKLNTMPDVIGYDPFAHNSSQTQSSPRDPMLSTSRKSKLDSSKINVYSTGFMHKIIFNKRNQLSDAKIADTFRHSGCAPSSDQLYQQCKGKFRHGISLHHMYTSPQFNDRQRSNSPQTTSPKNVSKIKI